MTEDRRCLDCLHGDGRHGLFPYVLWCSALSGPHGQVSALWARRTPPEARGCGPDATLFEERRT